MAYEAINNAGALKSRLLVILNDNNMSIAPATGALNGASQSPDCHRLCGAHAF